MKNLFYLLPVLLLLSCADDEGVTHSNQDENSVFYNVEVALNWNAQDFPIDYPSNAHFSPLVAWSHSEGHSFFMPSILASEGIKSMAESGKTSIIQSEIEAMIADNEGRCLIISDKGLSSGVGTINIVIEVNADNPEVSLSTMVAPSPDWYIGAVNVNLMDDSIFVDNLTVDGLVYDSGTDSGENFTSTNAVTSPQQPIALFVSSPLGDGNMVKSSICQVTFVKVKDEK